MQSQMNKIKLKLWIVYYKDERLCHVWFIIIWVKRYSGRLCGWFHSDECVCRSHASLLEAVVFYINLRHFIGAVMVHEDVMEFAKLLPPLITTINVKTTHWWNYLLNFKVNLSTVSKSHSSSPIGVSKVQIYWHYWDFKCDIVHFLIIVNYWNNIYREKGSKYMWLWLLLWIYKQCISTLEEHF